MDRVTARLELLATVKTQQFQYQEGAIQYLILWVLLEYSIDTGSSNQLQGGPTHTDYRQQVPQSSFKYTWFKNI